MKNLKFFTPLDSVLIIAVLALAIYGLLTFKVTQGTHAVVYLSNKKYGWYDLNSEKKRISVLTTIGEIEIEVGAGYAKIIHAPCPNQLCVKTGAVRHSHEEIVCMPGRLMIGIEGGQEAKAHHITDAITY